MWCQVHQCDQHAKEPDDVDDQHGAFDLRQLFGEVRVEDHGQDDDRVEEQRAVPSFEVVVGIVENKKPLDNGPSQVGRRSKTSLPWKNRLPAVMNERKLRHDLGAKRKVQWYCPPAVGALPWSAGRMACRRPELTSRPLSQGCNDREVPKPAEQVTVYESSWPTVCQAIHKDGQKPLPGNHQCA